MKNLTPVSIGIILSLVLCICYIISLDYIAYPWCDEIGTSDMSINYVTRGLWCSTVWPYTYHPLHCFLLTAWVFLFGHSHIAVCALGEILALITICILLSICYKRGYFRSKTAALVFTIIYWSLLWHCNGRIDMLTMLFTVLLIHYWLPANNIINYRRIKLFLCSFALMLTAIYPIPLLVIMAIYLTVTYSKNDRKIFILNGIIVASAFILSFLLVCYYYFLQQHLLSYLSTFIQFNSSLNDYQETFLLSRVVDSYRTGFVGNGYLITVANILGICFSIYKKDLRLISISVFVALVPFLMCIIGHYVPEYQWLVLLPTTCLCIYINDYILSNKYKRITLLLCSILLLLIPFRSYKHVDTVHNIRLQKEFVETNKQAIANAEIVIFNDPCFYYPLVDIDAKRQFLYRDLFVEAGSNFRFNTIYAYTYVIEDLMKKTPVSSEQLHQMEKGYDQYYKSGIVLTSNEDFHNSTLSYFKLHNITFEELFKDGDNIAISFDSSNYID